MSSSVAETGEVSGSGDDADPRGGLGSPSFLGLLVTQFLVALNDNMFRWLIVPIGKDLVGQDTALSVGAACFLLPFMIMAAPAGYMADRFSKRRVMIGCKVAEIVIMILGVLVILSGNMPLMFIVLFLMGAQSAFFSPSKYGSIPEIVRPDRLSAANGLIGMTTMFAVILGSVAGGYLYDATTVSKAVLVVESDAAAMGTVVDRVQSLGYRPYRARTAEEAFKHMEAGQIRLVLLGSVSTLTPGTVGRIQQEAGDVPVVEIQRPMPPVTPNMSAALAHAVQDRGPLEVVLHAAIGPPHQDDTGKVTLPGQHRLWISAAALVGVAIVGWLASLLIGRLTPANPQRPFPVNPAAQTYRDLAALVANRPLLVASAGSAFFWSLGVLAQVNIDKLASPELVAEQQYVGYLLAVLTLGIGVGSYLAGLWSAGRVEVGIVPLGAAGIAAATILLATVPAGNGLPLSGPYAWACFWLLLLGLSAGLYDIPLLAYMQEKSPDASRGRIWAAYNFLSFTGMFLTSGIFWVLTTPLGLSARQIFVVAGLVTILVAIAIIYLIPVATIRVLFGLYAALCYRVRIHGLENIPEKTGALLISNHLSFIDGLLVMYYCPRKIRMMADSRFTGYWLFRRLARQAKIIPIEPGKRSVVRSIRTAREALARGELMGMFPEGGLSRTGQIQSFHPGFMTILKGTGVPIIPVYLDGLWGSIFSFERRRYFWKWPRRWFRRVSLLFGQPVSDPGDAHQARLAVQQLGGEAMRQSAHEKLVLPRKFLRMCRRNMRRQKVADSTGAALTGAALLTRTLVLRRLLRRGVLADDENMVGILLPPTAAAVVANAAVSLDRRVSVNLNYTVSSSVMNTCIRKAGIRHVITSRRAMQKFDLQIEADLVYLEDFRQSVTRADKVAAAVAAWLVPTRFLESRLGLHEMATEELVTIIFTSGSTGEPKGVMLTHDNIGSNVDGFNQVLHLQRDDVMIGILPFFHSFGFTATLWSVLTLDPRGVYHFSPLEPRQVGKLCQEHRGTILLSTPTFLRSYLRRCQPEQLASLGVILTGAEKLPGDLADAFEKKFGIRPYEGYGTTELSPVVSANVPPERVPSPYQACHKLGTVGRPLPGIAAKVIDLDTGQDLGADKSGMLLIEGPNVMKGYLDQPALTAEVIRDGWYVTGDVALIDSDGFIQITGRESRFSKVGGEMVPHLRVEEMLSKILASDEEDVRLVVTSVPDPRKGERLVVLHTGLDRNPQEICRELGEAGLPGIWIPSPDSFCEVDEIPLLGTGKLDLRRVRELAGEKFPEPGT